jgi:MerR family transcriptional regulator, light-induced transcriptional regulator
MDEKMVQVTYKEFLSALLSGKRSRCSELANNYINDGGSIKELYENIIKKALYEVGELWEYNKISVATEHLASAIVEGLLNELYSRVISGNRLNKTVIVSCVENEYHQVGIKMISDVFEMNGWNSYFLGANTPTNELIAYAKDIKPDIFAVSLSIYFHLPLLEELIQKIRKEFPSMPILVGGQAFSRGGQDVLLNYDNVIYKPDLYSTEMYIKNINQNG